MKNILLSLILLILLSTLASAQTINFAWDAYTDTWTVSGFRLYASKTSGSYTTTPNATFSPSTLTTGSIPKSSLTGYGRWYFVLTAVVWETANPSNIISESGYSNEVSTTVTPKPPKLNSVVLAILVLPKKAVQWAMNKLDPKPKSGLRITGVS